MMRECVAAEASVAVEPKMEREETLYVRYWAIEFRPQVAPPVAAPQQFSRFRSEADMGKPFAEPNS